MASIGPRVKKLREDMGLTQADLAFLMGYTTARQIQRIEGEVSKLDSEQLKALAIFFDVTSDYLLGLTDDSSKQERNLPQKGVSVTVPGRYVRDDEGYIKISKISNNDKT
ncbi:helix-turn-helix domain-containing protein [Paenibacillus sp. CAU 1782]